MSSPLAQREDMLALDDYRALVALDDRFVPAQPAELATRAGLVRRVVRHLKAEGGLERLRLHSDWSQSDVEGQRRLMQAMLTVRGPEPLPHSIELAIDALLQQERQVAPEVAADALPRLADEMPQTSYGAAGSVALWQGDITRLGIDAIVNAANAQLLGCFQPFHACIDNAIHAAAGPRLRNDCHRIMQAQGHDEPTGTSKVTRGFNLPARFVLHTVGPIVSDSLANEHASALAACYRSCLDLAAAVGHVRAMAFCAVSTGVFGFPKRPAAEVALRTVDTWLYQHPGAMDLVVFNVFTAEDRSIYGAVLDH